jgi:hypothetical protein
MCMMLRNKRDNTYLAAGQARRNRQVVAAKKRYPLAFERSRSAF